MTTMQPQVDKVQLEWDRKNIDILYNKVNNMKGVITNEFWRKTF